MATDPGENSVVDLNARLPAPPSEAVRSRKRLRGFLLIGLALTVVGLMLDLFHFSPQSATRSDKVTALISGGEVPISIGGVSITATDALFSNDTSLATAIQQCGTDNQKYVPHANNRLTGSIMVLRVTGYGPVCVPDGQTRSFGSVKIEARNLAKTAEDGPGKYLQHSDRKHSVAYFKEIGLWVEPGLWDRVQSEMPNALLGAGLGILVTWLWERRRMSMR